jgi:RimJ/RimL family protein N-acetyltransferase
MEPHMSILGNDLLRGEKVYLNRLGSDDLHIMTEWFSKDFGMMQWLGQHPMYPWIRQDLETWHQKSSEDADRFLFAIRSLVDDSLLGFCVLFHVDWRSNHAELGITLGDASKRGKGLGSDAIRVLLRFGFMELNLHRIYLVVQSENIRGIKSYEKVGFLHEGAEREAMLREGRYTDLVWMSVLRHEWERHSG